MSEVSQTAQSYREQGLTVAVHRACTTCGAPGVYHDLEWILHTFPACHVTSDDPRIGQPVGEECPSCSAKRAPSLTERLGEIWRRRFAKT